MNSETQKLLDQIVTDKKLLQKMMTWEADSTAMATVSAFLFAAAGKTADIERYAECKRYFKKNVGIFSEMRGVAEVIVITKMCLSDNYMEYLEGATTVYRKLRSLHKLTASPYMVMAALTIYEAGGLAKADENIERLENIYHDMKGDHFWLTGDEDRPFIAMLASRDVDFRTIAPEIDACYEASKSMSFSKSAMHTASQIMSLSSKDVSEKVSNLADTMTALKNNGIKGMKSDLMPVVAAMGLIPGSAQEKAVAVKEIYDYLKTQKGFKWYIGGTKRSMYSLLAYAIENLKGDNTVMNSVISATLANIIMDEIITLIIISSTVHNISRSSGNN